MPVIQILYEGYDMTFKLDDSDRSPRKSEGD